MRANDDPEYSRLLLAKAASETIINFNATHKMLKTHTTKQQQQQQQNNNNTNNNINQHTSLN
jgi:hypothetical protein